MFFGFLYLIFKSKPFKITLLFVFITILLFFFYSSFILLFFVLIAALSLLHTMFTKNYIGFELCTLVTVITAMKFGAFTGAIVGATSVVAGLVISRNIDPGIVASIFGFALIAIVASFFGFGEIVFVGVILTIVYDVIIGVFYYFSGSNPFTILFFSLTHILLNYLIFSSLSTFFIGLLS